MAPSNTPPLSPQHTPTPQPTESIESAIETRVQSPESRVPKILTSVTEVIDQLPTPNLMIASDVERFATPRLKPCHSPPSKSLTHSESKQDTDKTKTSKIGRKRTEDTPSTDNGESAESPPTTTRNPYEEIQHDKSSSPHHHSNPTEIWISHSNS